MDSAILELCNGLQHTDNMMLDMPGKMFSLSPRKVPCCPIPFNIKMILINMVWVKTMTLDSHFKCKYPLNVCEMQSAFMALSVYFVTFNTVICYMWQFLMSHPAVFDVSVWSV